MIATGDHVLVLGAGRSGQAAARLLQQQGARVTLYDRDREGLDAVPLAVERISGPEPPAFGSYDRVVTSPGIPMLADPKLVPEVDLAAELLEAPIVGVTGTNGKGTTVTLIADMLEQSGLEVRVGGNIGTPLCSLVGESADWIVAELSSFQLEHAKRLHARVAVLLNLTPDHLDRHGSLSAYGAAKEQLTRLQGADDVLVLNADDPWAAGVGERTRAHVEQFSTQKLVESGAFLAGDDCVLRASEHDVLRVSLGELSTPCKSPVANALAALAAAHAAGATPQGMQQALAHFEGLPHRVQEICMRRGVLFVDDSKATNPAAAATSLAAQTRPVWWLAGGQNKGLDFAPLTNASAGIRGAIVFGEAAQELGDALAAVTEVTRVHSLDEAVRDAAARATSGDVVLLAPACASYDAFASFEERGDHFAELARALPC